MSNCYKIFLTVGNKQQKQLCEKLIPFAAVEEKEKIFVISDDSQLRLGSGGAVLNIVRSHYNDGEKILIINCGGESKRSINYAVRGKAFANLLKNGNPTTLLELILSGAEKIMGCIDSGILICCSDILVNTDNFDKSDFTESAGICLDTDFTVASRHGVMLPDENGLMQNYLHKQPPEKLKEFHSSKGRSSALIDTGITYFSNALSMALLSLSSEINPKSADGFEISLYSDIIAVLSKEAEKKAYLENDTMNEAHLQAKARIFDALSTFSFRVLNAGEQKFLHFGTLRESIENIFSLSGKESSLLCFNSYCDKSTKLGERVLLDNCELTRCETGNNCIVSDVSLSDISIGDNKAVCGIKLCDGSFVTVICDINENPKSLSDGISLWELPRFYKASDFNSSIKKYFTDSPETKYSMEYIVKNADYGYYLDRVKYLNDKNDYTVNESYLEKRREIIAEHLTEDYLKKEFICIKDRAEIHLPLRVNMSGTWTDAMPYCVDNGGQVINMAVRINGEKPVSVVAERLDSDKIEFCSEGTTVTFDFNKSNSEEDLSDFILHKAVLEAIGITPDTVIRNGFRLTTSVKGIDKGSGLGVSSILLGGCFKALGELSATAYSDEELIKMVFVAEQLMKTGGGWQDQVGGLTPGLKSGTSLPGTVQRINVKYIELSDFFKKIFSERLVLLPTGQRHFGRFIVNDVVNRYLQKNEESIEGHREILELNRQLEKSLDDDNYHEFAFCINKHRELLKKISHKVTNEVIDGIVDKCFELADAVSFLGAGGGGYLLVLLKEDVSFKDFEAFVRLSFPHIRSDVKKIEPCYDI